MRVKISESTKNNMVEVYNTLSEYEKAQIEDEANLINTYTFSIHIAKEDGNPIGFSLLKTLPDEYKNEKVKELCIICAVKPDYRGTGVGEFLIREAVNDFIKSDYDQLVWNCDKKNIASEKLAEKCGFSFGWEKDNGETNVFIMTNLKKVFNLLKTHFYRWDNKEH